MSNPGAEKPAVELVTLTIDGQELSVPKGTNLIEAAKTIGVDIPHYCYHPDLSIAGNCRMCQVKIEGAPKMEIACNCAVKAGMKVSTHKTSKEVADTQAATLEFILINHPLDCTICDQAGHCKLQDYHFEYNAKPSRFLENKEHKPKAVPLGETVMLDAERCIMCTRCVRFCDEVTKTSELGMLNRGDRSMIAVNPGRKLNNPFSGTVVDLCPVGALTHAQWRFNTRIWFTSQTKTICPGCSTGCNVRVATRDGEVVQVKARYSKEVNKELLCDEGRYGFNRLIPKNRLLKPKLDGRDASWSQALSSLAALKGSEPVVVLAAPDLLLEEYSLLKQIVNANFKHALTAVAFRERDLSALESILISPDRSPNFRAAEYACFTSNNAAGDYGIALAKVRLSQAAAVIIVGERAIFPEDIDDGLLHGLRAAKFSAAMLASDNSPLLSAVQVAMPSRIVLEKSGLFMNRKGRLQYIQRCFEPVAGSEPEWRILMRMANMLGQSFVEPESERSLTLEFLEREERLRGKSLKQIKDQGVTVDLGARQ